MIVSALMLPIAVGFVALLAHLDRDAWGAPRQNALLVNTKPFRDHPPYTVTVMVVRSHRLSFRRWLVFKVVGVRCDKCNRQPVRVDDPSHLWEGKRVEDLCGRWRDAWRPLTSEQALRRLCQQDTSAPAEDEPRPVSGVVS